MQNETKQEDKRYTIVSLQLKIWAVVYNESNIRKGCTKDAHGTESEDYETESSSLTSALSFILLFLSHHP